MTLSPTLISDITPTGSDYDTVRRVVELLTVEYREQPTLEVIARHVGETPAQLQRTFTRWAGLTPKAFLQAVTLDHAKRLLGQESLPLLDTSFELGLSGPGRLHDLFVTHEAMSPGEWKARGAGLTIHYAFHPSPFGTALVMATERGLAGLAFCDDGGEAASFDDIVWEALLKIPMGRATTYSDIAKGIGQPTASRAVGAAVGRNPISFVVPCHRALGKSGALTGYHWGLTRKRAMLGWEAGQIAAA